MNKLRYNIEQKLLNIWYNTSSSRCPINKSINLILSLLSKIYLLVIKIRKILYKLNCIKSYKAAIPVIIVGNITVGGTGKTPVVIALVEHLKSQGFKPGIITRGYRSKTKLPFLLTKYVNYDVSTEITGDEAKLLYNRTLCPVAISPNRTESVKLLMANNLCNVVVSDDGLQHYKLNRDIEICLLDDSRMFGNNKLLPAGPLRETNKRIDDIDFVLIKNRSFEIQNEGFVCLNNNVIVALENILPTHSNNKKTIVHVYAGLGNNQNFFDYLSNVMKPLNIDEEFIKHSFEDHCNYSVDNFNILDANSKGEVRNIIITTEKDAVKIREVLNNSKYLEYIYYLKINADLNKDFLFNFDFKVSQLMKQYDIKSIKKLQEVELC